MRTCLETAEDAWYYCPECNRYEDFTNGTCADGNSANENASFLSSATSLSTAYIGGHLQSSTHPANLDLESEAPANEVPKIVVRPWGSSEQVSKASPIPHLSGPTSAPAWGTHPGRPGGRALSTRSDSHILQSSRSASPICNAGPLARRLIELTKFKFEEIGRTWCPLKKGKANDEDSDCDFQKALLAVCALFGPSSPSSLPDLLALAQITLAFAITLQQERGATCLDERLVSDVIQYGALAIDPNTRTRYQDSLHLLRHAASILSEGFVKGALAEGLARERRSRTNISRQQFNRPEAFSYPRVPEAIVKYITGEEVVG